MQSVASTWGWTGIHFANMNFVQFIAHMSAGNFCKSNAFKLKTAHHADPDRKQTLHAHRLQMKHDTFAGACILM